MKRHLLVALILATALPTLHAQVENRFAATLAPAERFELDAVLVEKHGQRGRPLILIPGLASGSWVWQETVRQFSGDYIVYVLTLPGFDGRPAASGPAMAAAQKAVADLIDKRKLVKPVLIGHSLGGTLSYAVAAQLGPRIGGVVSIDGLPVFPGSENLGQEQREELAQSLRRRMMPASAGAFAAQQQQYMRGTGVTDMARADELAKLSAKSDVAAVMQYMAEIFAMDLRPVLPKITVPVMVMAPYFGEDDTQNQVTQQVKTDYYTALLDGLAKVEVVSVAPARHFAMFDQPQQVHDAIRRFLASLPRLNG